MTPLPKPVFCKLLGHTWQHHVEDPKTVWTANKNQCELDQETVEEPRFYQRCVRCGVERPWDEKDA